MPQSVPCGTSSAVRASWSDCWDAAPRRRRAACPGTSSTCLVPGGVADTFHSGRTTARRSRRCWKSRTGRARRGRGIAGRRAAACATRARLAVIGGQQRGPASAARSTPCSRRSPSSRSPASSRRTSAARRPAVLDRLRRSRPRRGRADLDDRHGRPARRDRPRRAPRRRGGKTALPVSRDSARRRDRRPRSSRAATVLPPGLRAGPEALARPARGVPPRGHVQRGRSAGGCTACSRAPASSRSIPPMHA